MSVRRLTDLQMLELAQKALGELINCVGFDNRIGGYESRQVGVDFDAGNDRLQEPDEFYKAVAVPLMSRLAEEIGDAPSISCWLDAIRGSVTAMDNCVFMRLWISRDFKTDKEVGRFDFRYRPA